ncbi:MAG: hypothetical protein COY81_03860 [Candidatus Pacebacteria bacterium CG_4_10_14_0_8_um_filter_43_12]|nr:MAG: hypothetical protein COY81_03860 [Candidatus Pacebacteria bacterium CG_4_10_14_0_8_um_filter_43_12]
MPDHVAMTQLLQQKPATKPQQTGSANPFARALSEMEKTADASGKPSSTDAFREALMRAQGGDRSAMAQTGFGDMQSEDYFAQQQAELQKQQEQLALRKKLHDRVNPVDNQALFDARDKQVKDQIDKLRNELKMLSRDVKSLNKEVELTLMTKVTDPGEHGAYFVTFFEQLRTLIMLLRKNIKEASTWLKAARGKQQRGKQQKGLLFGKGSKATSTVQDITTNSERNISYGGA